jgi:hypothetical protein
MAPKTVMLSPCAMFCTQGPAYSKPFYGEARVLPRHHQCIRWHQRWCSNIPGANYVPLLCFMQPLLLARVPGAACDPL